MNLDEAQRKKVATWIADGLKLAEIQNRLVSEFGMQLTYMEVRLLVDDLKLTPKDPERPKPADLPATPTAATEPPGAAPAPTESLPPGGVSVSVDALARPGALASG